MGKLTQSNPLALPRADPILVHTISYTPSHPDGVHETTTDYSVLSGVLLAFLIGSTILNFFTWRGRNEYERKWRELDEQPSRSILPVIRRLQSRARDERSDLAGSNRTGIEQPQFPPREQSFRDRRDGRERHQHSPVQDRPRHPYGSSLEALARCFGTRGTNGRSSSGVNS